MKKPDSYQRLAKLVKILAFLIPLFTMGYMLLYAELQDKHASEVTKNLQFAKLAADYMDDYIKDIKTTLTGAAGLAVVRSGNSREISNVLNNLQLAHPEASLLFAADAKGNLLAKVPENYPNQNILDRDFFQSALHGKDFVGGPYIGRVTAKEIVVICVPVFNSDQVVGVLGASIPLQELQKKAASVRVGHLGYAMLLAKNGLFLAHPDLEHVRQMVNPFSDPVLKQIVNSCTGSLEAISSFDNNRKLFSYVTLQEAPWVFVIIQPMSELHSQWEQTLVRNGFVLTLVLLFVIVAVRYYALLKERINAERAQMAEKLALVGELAAGMAHEIRNPLTAIKGFVQLLQGYKTSRPPDIYLETIVTELDRINQIVSEMLILAKPSPAKFVSLNLREITSDVLTLLKPQAESKHIRLELESVPDLPPIEGEPNQLKQVLINLIKNAMEATESCGHGQVTVKLSKPSAKNVLVQVIDTGIGIPKEHLQHLGTPFFTTKESGTGLGLMVSYRIIQNHQGEISVTSSPSQGTNISLILPISQHLN